MIVYLIFVNMVSIYLQHQKTVLQMIRTVWAADGLRGLLCHVDLKFSDPVELAFIFCTY